MLLKSTIHPTSPRKTAPSVDDDARNFVQGNGLQRDVVSEMQPSHTQEQLENRTLAVNNIRKLTEPSG